MKEIQVRYKVQRFDTKVFEITDEQYNKAIEALKQIYQDCMAVGNCWDTFEDFMDEPDSDFELMELLGIPYNLDDDGYMIGFTLNNEYHDMDLE